MAGQYYTQLEYLEATGTQYLNAGVRTGSGVQEFILETEIAWSKINSERQLSGADNSQWIGVTDGRWEIGGSRGPTYTVDQFYKVKNIVSIEQEQRYTRVYVDDVLGIEAVAQTASIANNQQLVFNIPNYNYYCSCKMKYWRLTRDGIVICDLMPVLDKNKVPCMYDKISNTLLYNQGTGVFSYGKEIHPVEYLESTGTQYIDTGYIPSNTTGVKVKHTICANNGTDNILFGCRQDSGNTRFWEDVDWSQADNIGWGFNTYSGNTSGYRYPLTNDMVGQTITSSLNFMNDRACKINGISYDPNPQTATLTTLTRPIYLLGANNQGSFGYANACKIFTAQISNEQTLVRDYIPVRDENGIGYLFDKANYKLYANAGSDNFKVGPDTERGIKKEMLYKKFFLMLSALKKKKRKYYCEVEYLKSNGVDLMYIAPGLNYFPDFEVGVKCDESSDKNCTLGTDANNLFERNNATNPYWRLKASGTSFISSVEVSTYADAKYKDGVFSVNGTVVGNKDNTFPSGALYLFRAPSGTNSYKMSIHFFKAWNSNGKLVRDMIPVLDWEYVPCMYDKVTDSLFYNAGAGNFTYGREIHYVDYLEMDGDQYFDTGLIGNGEFVTKYGAKLTQFAKSGLQTAIIGGARSSGQHLNFGQWDKNGNFSLAYLNKYWSITDLYLNLNQDYDITVVSKSGDQHVEIDGVEYGNQQNTGTEATDLKVYFGKRNHYSTDNVGGFIGILRYLQIWQNDKFVCDFYPAIDENGLGYMFDKVEHRIHDNLGTGKFKYPIKEIEYLQTTGTQYINTNYIPDQTVKVRTDFELLAKPSDTYASLFGSFVTGAYNGFMLFLNYTVPIQARTGSGSNPNTISNYNVNIGRYDLTLEFNKLTINGDTFTPASANTWVTLTNPLYLFTGSGTDMARRFVACKLYSSQVISGSTVVRDFIPVIKNGELGLWDKENEVFYANAGTGTFGGGKIVEPEY